MIIQRKTLLSAIAVILVIVIVIIFSYRYFTAKPISSNSSKNTVSQMQDNPSQSQTDVSATPLVTPDSTVDAIINDAALDDATLQSDVKNEKAAISASSTDINTLSQSYDETKL